MRPTSRFLRTLALVLAALLVAVGAATPVQAASKKDRYYQFTSAVMRYTVEDAADDAGLVLTSETFALVEEAARNPWMFTTSNKICKYMNAAKTSAARKRTTATIVDTLSDAAVEQLHELYDASVEMGTSDDEVYFFSAMVAAQYATTIIGAQKVLCPKQARHLGPMVDAYLAAVEKKLGV